MPIVRQLPKLFLRGSLATMTMANMTEQERQNVGDLVIQIANHKEMVKHKQEIIKQFGVTIGGDYADDRAAAENEYQIAIWRGVISLLYHQNYSYECKACKQSSYKTKRGKMKAIDQKQLCCPNCRKVQLKAKGSIELDSDFIDYDEYRQLLKSGHNNCEIESPIVPIAGDKKYQDPEVILSDPRQIKKFFGEFAWNYFRQHLKENKRQEHKRSPQVISGKPDFVISEELISACSQMGIDYHYAKDDNGYSFNITGLQTPPEFSVEYSRIKERADRHGIAMEIDANTISIRVTDVSSNQDDIEAIVIKPEHVTILDNQQNVTEDECSTLDQVDYKFVEGHKMILEDHVAAIESTDAMTSIRKSLPEGLCRSVYDVYIQNGDTYDAFCDKYGTGEPKLNQMAEFFGQTIRAINEVKEQIKVMCIYHGLTP